MTVERARGHGLAAARRVGPGSRDVRRGARGAAWIVAGLLAWQALLAPPLSAQDIQAHTDDLVTGLFVRVKGELDGRDLFVASSVEVRAPDDEEELVGTPRAVAPDGSRFELLGQPVMVAARTEWKGVTPDELGRAQVKVEGHWRGPARFSAREIEERKSAGRDRLEGRIDALRREGGQLRLRIMRFEVVLRDDVLVESEIPVAEWERAPARVSATARVGGDDDDEITAGLALGEALAVGLQLEAKLEHEGDYDLDESKREDVRSLETSVRGELVWEPSDDAWFVVGFRKRASIERDESEPTLREGDDTLTEAYVGLRDPFGLGVDVLVGRQDFDDPREWIYDENLDAVRLIWRGAGLQAEVSASTVLADGGPANRETTNFMAYVSNGDDDRHLAAYVIDRRRSGDVREKPFYMGLRALGDWFPDQDVWGELALLRGYGEVDYRGWAVDLGTTWSPPALEPLRLTLSVAHGSGDDDPDDDVDTSFRQDGLQDNTGRFGGVTSFRYYGELVDPELSNVTVITAGVGARLGRRSSLDLVWHHFRQAVAADRQSSDIDTRPDGVHRDLGHELDLVFGSRAPEGWQTEVVLGRFWPGSAYDGKDGAWLGKVQLRRRF